MSTLFLTFYISVVFAQTPFSCLEELKEGKWPKDCLIYLQQEDLEDELTTLKVKNWCIYNKNQIIREKSYKFLNKAKVLQECRLILNSSDQFHYYRRVQLMVD